MATFIRWEADQRREGFHGFLGEERICVVIPWQGESDRWPWQLQTLNSAFLHSEFVVAARTSAEAMHLAEQGVVGFLFRTKLQPATAEQLDAIIPERDRDAEQDRLRWLRETGWYEPIHLESDDE
ncbi:hypothetical protein ACI2KT_00960 [Ensifer adhaerens]|uniref:hypothetical protein n=1 Tax=Ensifer adhaerens TaxID=106592 RepID=UPI00384FBBC7